MESKLYNYTSVKQLFIYIFIAALFISGKSLLVTNYYVSVSGNDANDGLTISTPWQTLNKVNSFAYSAGSQVNFNRGETFYGSIIPNIDNMVYTAYGTGLKPVISGFTTLSSWTNMGAGIYKINVPAATGKLINVLVDGQQVRMGRYPNYNSVNGGWLFYESVGTNSITDNQLTTTPYNWTGAEAVIKKYNYIIDRCPITSQVVGTLTYTNPMDVYNNPVSGTATPNFGYFFQNDIRTLDSSKEWFINPSTKDFSMFFAGADVPGNHVIKVSTIDTLFNCGAGGYASTGRTIHNNITTDNLSFEGANDWAFYSSNGTGMVTTNCTFTNNQGGIYSFYNNSLITGDTIINTLDKAIQLIGPQTLTKTISNNYIRNCGLIDGMGKASGVGYSAIQVEGDNEIITLNTIDSVGFNAIQFNDNNVRGDSNLINHYCMTKSDGGGIYNFAQTTKTNRNIYGNIILNGVGNRFGNDNQPLTMGVYTDGSNNINIINNSISVTDGVGIFGNNENNIRATGNTIYNVPTSINFNRRPGTTASPSALVRNNFITSNISYPTVNNFFYWNGQLNEPSTISIQTDMQLIGAFDSNYYRSGLAASWDYYYHLTAGGTFIDPPPITTLGAWQTFIAGESHSNNISTAATVFQYNASSSPTTYNFTGLSKTDVFGTVYNNSASIPAWSSKILFYNGAAPSPGACVNCIYINRVIKN